MDEELERDEKVFLLGEEVAQYDGAYKVTKIQGSYYKIEVTICPQRHIKVIGSMLNFRLVEAYGRNTEIRGL